MWAVNPRNNNLQSFADYLEDLGQRIQSLHRQGLSAHRIRRKLLGRELPITYNWT